MTDLEKQLKRIQDKLQLLLKQQALLQKENQRLQIELENCKATALRNQEVTDNLKQQVEILKISSGNWDESDKKEFEKRINNYIKEIDRCIAFLSA
jgi:hypothetical protein